MTVGDSPLFDQLLADRTNDRTGFVQRNPARRRRRSPFPLDRRILRRRNEVQAAIG